MKLVSDSDPSKPVSASVSMSEGGIRCPAAFCPYRFTDDNEAFPCLSIRQGPHQCLDLDLVDLLGLLVTASSSPKTSSYFYVAPFSLEIRSRFYFHYLNF